MLFLSHQSGNYSPNLAACSIEVGAALIVDYLATITRDNFIRITFK